MLCSVQRCGTISRPRVIKMSTMNSASRSLEKLLVKLRGMLPTLRAQYRVHTLEVFGSFVRGEERADSDLDLVVTFDEVPGLIRFVANEFAFAWLE